MQSLAAEALRSLRHPQGTFKRFSCQCPYGTQIGLKSASNPGLALETRVSDVAPEARPLLTLIVVPGDIHGLVVRVVLS